MAKAGDNVGFLLRGVKREAIRRGMFLCNPGTLRQTDCFKARVYVLTEEEGGRRNPVTNYNTQVRAAGKRLRLD